MEKKTPCAPNWCPARAVKSVENKHISSRLDHEDLTKIGRLITHPHE